MRYAELDSADAATPPPSTVHSSEYESGWDPLLLSETGVSGSDDSPCRVYHPLTFPRDGHLPSHDATGSDEFPAKPVVMEWEGLDEMGPWLRVKDTDRLLLGDRTVHWSPDCPFLSGRSFGLAQCYCADKLHKCFHYDVDDNFCSHGNSRWLKLDREDCYGNRGANFAFLDLVSPFAVLHDFRWINLFVLMGGTLSDSARRESFHMVLSMIDIGHSYSMP